MTNPPGQEAFISADSTLVGRKYLFAFIIFFLLAGVLALIMRIQHLAPDHVNLSVAHYNQAFTFHGAIMMFLFALPAIPAVFGNLLLPRLLNDFTSGSRFYRQLSWYCFLGGCFFLLGVLSLETYHVGWSFYQPFEVNPENQKVFLILTGFVLLHLSSLFLSLIFIQAIHRQLRSLKEFFQLAPFAQSLYLSSLLTVFTSPALFMTFIVILLSFFSVGGFQNGDGAQHMSSLQSLFFFYTHPSVYFMILPAIGLIADFSGVQRRYGITSLMSSISLVLIATLALLRFLLWLITTLHGVSLEKSQAMSSIMMEALAVPLLILVLCGGIRLLKFQRAYLPAQFIGMNSLLMILVGIMTGLYVSSIAEKGEITQSYFLVAHFHCLLIGGPALAFVGGLYHTLAQECTTPRLIQSAKVFSLLIGMGFLSTFIPQFYMGAHRAGRHLTRLPQSLEIWNQLSALGSLLLGGAFLGALLIPLLLLLKSHKRIE